MKLFVPFSGRILRKNAIVQFTRTPALLPKSGLSIMATLGEALQPILTLVVGMMAALTMLSVFVPLVTMIDKLGVGNG